MKYVPRMPIPWDMLVFLTITTTGFGFSVHRLAAVDKQMISTELSREVSSLPNDVSHATTDLGCLETSLSTQRLKSEVGTIRLRGKFCHLSARAMRAFDGMQIKNLTNGYEGTVFFQGYDATFVSDYVVLVPGRNEIEIAWRERAGHPSRRVIAEVYEN